MDSVCLLSHEILHHILNCISIHYLYYFSISLDELKVLLKSDGEHLSTMCGDIMAFYNFIK